MIAATKLKQAQTLRRLVAEYEEAKERHRGGVLALADKIFELDDDAGASADCLGDRFLIDKLAENGYIVWLEESEKFVISDLGFNLCKVRR